MVRPAADELDAEGRHAGTGRRRLGVAGRVRLVQRIGGDLLGLGQALEGEALLVVVGHVVAGLAEDAADGGHVRGRPAGVGHPFGQVRSDRLKGGSGETAAQPHPPFGGVVTLADVHDPDVRHHRGDRLEFPAEDDVGRCARGVHEQDVGIGAEVEQGPRHRHHRGDAAAGGQEQILRRRRSGQGELAERGEDGDPGAGRDVVVQPVRDRPTDHPLDRDGDQVRPGRRGGDGVAAADRLPVDLELQGDELTRLEVEDLVADRLEHEGLDVVGDLEDGPADELGLILFAPAVRRPRRRDQSG